MQNPVCGTGPGLPDGKASLHLISAQDEITFLHDLIHLIHMASRLIPEIERAAIQAGLSALDTQLEHVADYIRLAQEGQP